MPAKEYKSNQSRDKASKLPLDWELGLSVLECHSKFGRPFSQEEIGCACGVTSAAVSYLEKRAMRKLHNRLQFTDHGRELLSQIREILRSQNSLTQ